MPKRCLMFRFHAARRLRTCVLLLAAGLAGASWVAGAALGQDSGFEAAHTALVNEIKAYGRMDPPPGRRGFSDQILDVMGAVPRHEFVPKKLWSEAYDNHPLPIGHGQTISQPYIVALMTELAEPGRQDTVLEIGTGSGYQAAVLAKLVGQVYSIEIIEPLHLEATARLERLGYDNVATRLGDGYFGWADKGPFDAIVVTAAASHVPPPLIEQLKPGGRMVIPVGGRLPAKYLLLVTKNTTGEIVTRQITAVRFVPLTGER
jgi:protein-L-isoaspartate(D-aspartate) O-methyltransferase